MEKDILEAKRIIDSHPPTDIASEIGVSSLYIRQIQLGSKTLNSTLAARVLDWQKQRVTEALPNKCEQKEKGTEQIIVNLPRVKLLTPHFSSTKGDEEVAILIAGDGHAGKITKSFDKEVYRERMEEMFQSTMKIVNLHRNMYPIKKLIIANVGDNTQGENPHQGSRLGETECGARDQVMHIAAPAWNDVIASFKQNFEEVAFHAVPGNHGHEQLAPKTTSFDLILYDILKAGIGAEKGISINYDDWYNMFSIFGFRFFMFHGDSIKSQKGVPFFALDDALKNWYMQFAGFNYAISGHFHKAYYHAVSSRLEHFMNGTLVSDDDWVLKKLKISSHPAQTLIGVHPTYGVTWKYTLTVDNEFLPEPREGRQIPDED